MRYFLVGVAVLAAWTTFSRWRYVCHQKDWCSGEKTEKAAAIPRTADLSLIADGKAVLEGYEQFGFLPNSITPELSVNNEAFIAEVEKYLKENPDAKIQITGYYMESEKDVKAGMFENLGVARAAKIRDILVGNGIDVNRIGMDADMVADLSKPLAFRARNPVVADNANARPEEYDNFETQQFTFTNMNFSDINFDYNSAVFNPSDAFKTYADSVSTYFKENTDKTLVVIGHTDSDGTDAYNMNLGSKRAKSVKAYFAGLGIKNSAIKTQSKGESSPAFPNDTDNNKRKNRRVNILIE